MKPSRYNIIIDAGDGRKLAFNSATAALAEIDPETFSRITSIFTDPSTVDHAANRVLVKHLRRGGFLVEKDLDEVASLRMLNRMRRTGNTTFFLTIAPTLACNFGCDYCFENSQSHRMSESTQDALLRFSDEHIRDAEQMLITWFGGEPTLCLDIIEKLHGNFIELATKHRIALLPSSIITNGYMLDQPMAERLRSAGVGEAQVTLDGPEAAHDARRKLRNGKGTFRRIVDNLAMSSDILKIVVRVNVDRTNLSQAHEVIELLDREGILPKVNVYFAQVNSTGATCADMRDRCFSTEEFARGQTQLYRQLVADGFYGIEYPSLAPGGHCGADTKNSFVVSPDGYLFKCWEEVALAAENSVGSVFSDELLPNQKANLSAYESWNPFTKDRCVECEVLPICIGGCPYHGMKKTAQDSGLCCTWKYNLQDMLLLRYLCEQRKEVNA